MWVCLWQNVGKEKDEISIRDVKQFAKEIHIDGNINTEVGKISIPDLSDVVNRTNELAKTDTKELIKRINQFGDPDKDQTQLKYFKTVI